MVVAEHRPGTVRLFRLGLGPGPQPEGDAVRVVFIFIIFIVFIVCPVVRGGRLQRGRRPPVAEPAPHDLVPRAEVG